MIQWQPKPELVLWRTLDPDPGLLEWPKRRQKDRLLYLLIRVSDESESPLFFLVLSIFIWARS